MGFFRPRPHHLFGVFALPGESGRPFHVRVGLLSLLHNYRIFTFPIIDYLPHLLRIHHFDSTKIQL